MFLVSSASTNSSSSSTLATSCFLSLIKNSFHSFPCYVMRWVLIPVLLSLLLSEPLLVSLSLSPAPTSALAGTKEASISTELFVSDHRTKCSEKTQGCQFLYNFYNHHFVCIKNHFLSIFRIQSIDSFMDFKTSIF